MTTFSSAGYTLANGDGQHIRFLGKLMSIKAGREQTRGGFTLIEHVSRPNLRHPHTSTMPKKKKRSTSSRAS